MGSTSGQQTMIRSATADSDSETMHGFGTPRITGLDTAPAPPKGGSTFDAQGNAVRGKADKPEQGERPADAPGTGMDKLMNTDEMKDAQEFKQKFGRNPNSPEAISWLEQKIREHAEKEAKGLHNAGEQDGLTHAGDAGLGYGTGLLLQVGTYGCDTNKVNWSYFHNGSAFDPRAGWTRMHGLKEI
jgi:hypothetical protein